MKKLLGILTVVAVVAMLSAPAMAAEVTKVVPVNLSIASWVVLTAFPTSVTIEAVDGQDFKTVGIVGHVQSNNWSNLTLSVSLTVATGAAGTWSLVPAPTGTATATAGQTVTAAPFVADLSGNTKSVSTTATVGALANATAQAASQAATVTFTITSPA